MTKIALAKIVEAARCKLVGWEDARNDGHRKSLAILIRAFDNSESALLCEPSLARMTRRPPDIVLIDPEVGVHVFEVKGISLEQIERIEAGGQLHIQYGTRIRPMNLIAQVRNAMFDIKHATIRAFGAEVRLPFKYWVVFPFIQRLSWEGRFGAEGFCPPEFLFGNDLDSPDLARQLGASDRAHSSHPIRLCPLDQLQCVWHAFGDTSVLYCTPAERGPRHAAEGTLGAQFDAAAESYKKLSDEQQRLAAMNWEGGPRQIRGVAGSGKTIVLAINLARCLERRLIAANENLFDPHPRPPRILAVCFNRKLAPLIEKKIRIAYRQRNARDLPPDSVDVCSFNALMWKLTTAGLWRYQSVRDIGDIVRAMRYVDEIQQFRQRDPERMKSLQYDAVYVDEGQDFYEEEFRLLKELCRVEEGAEPNLYVFYDDAQNLYGRRRPNWQSIGLNVRGGRSFVMTQCFRNTRSIVETTFNVLYGTCAASPGKVPTREFGDIATLEQKELIHNNNGYWRVTFAGREGIPPRLSILQNIAQENESIIARLRWLIGDQQVRVEDIQVLAFHRQRVEQLAGAIDAARIPGIAGILVAFEDKDKDRSLMQEGCLALSTVASAKGYDAYCVLLASANEFTADVKRRASFYVGCTRAIEFLEVFAYQSNGLAVEFEAALAKSSVV